MTRHINTRVHKTANFDEYGMRLIILPPDGWRPIRLKPHLGYRTTRPRGGFSIFSDHGYQWRPIFFKGFRGTFRFHMAKARRRNRRAFFPGRYDTRDEYTYGREYQLR